ncbi:putative nuclease HARBI1 [Cucumis melo var. makuwa]|uniref:Putative nuclease HARBI1 n=1 Tax=Cucumis melo var. makuwa TaxID=1194695 RepID=A0A5D3BM55_CUCMM|nr:putative nuclease HARBI1 [Cucumis melo var. makuwa]
MDQQTLLRILTAFPLVQHQMLLMLEHTHGQGKIVTNVLGVYDMKGDFIYVTVGKVLQKTHGFSRMLKGYYYLCDVGYPNAKRFLTPYRGQRYHLQEWCGAGNSPTTTVKEYVNMKHSSTRNMI